MHRLDRVPVAPTLGVTCGPPESMSSAGFCFDLGAFALSVGDGEAGLPGSSEPAVDRFGLLWLGRGAGEWDTDARGRGEARRSLVVLLTRLLNEHINPHPWRIERALSSLSCFRRMHVRWDRDSGRWFALVLVACAVFCFNRL